MSLLFGYASDLELVEEDVDMNGNRIVDLPEPTTKGQKDVDHEITKTTWTFTTTSLTRVLTLSFLNDRSGSESGVHCRLSGFLRSEGC